MALAHPIFVPLYANGGFGSVIKVMQGAAAVINANEFWQTGSPTQYQYPVKNCVVFGGNIIFIQPNVSFTSQGWWEFNPRTGLFHIASFGSAPTGHLIAVGKYLILADTQYVMRGLSPKFSDIAPQFWSIAGAANDWVMHGDTLINPTNGGYTRLWTYPFTNPPAHFSHTRQIHRVCIHKGEVYGLHFSAPTCYLHRYVAGSWVTIRTGFTPAENGKVQLQAGALPFFSVGSKLWVMFTYTGVGGASTYQHRLYELDTTTGNGTDVSATYLASTIWFAPQTTSNRYAFEVIDDIGTTRKIYLFSLLTGVETGWACYEFDGTNPFSAVHSGSHRFGMSCGAIYDENAHGCHVSSGVDSTPSSYMNITHRVSDLKNNGLVDVDLRYENLGASPAQEPIFPQCTEKAGFGEGKTNLTSAPTPPGTIAGLSDNFDDASIDLTLWERVYLSIVGQAVSRVDRSAFYGGQFATYYTMAEQGGSLRFGGTSPTPWAVQYTGVGVKSRWGVNGAFQADVVVSDLAALNSDGGGRLWFYAKQATNEMFGIFLAKASGIVTARGIYQQPNGTAVLSTNTVSPLADGDTLRLARDGAGNITLTVIKTGVPTVLTWAVAPSTYTGEIQFWMGCCTETGSNWTSVTPGPGVSDFTVSGAGTVGKWEGEMDHIFAWDHIADLGAGVSTGVVIHADTD